MEIETISEILVGVSTACICVAIWLHNRQMQAWYAVQREAVNSLMQEGKI